MNTKFTGTASDLPPGLMRPQFTINHQPCLFRVTLAEVLARLSVSADDLRRWHDRGWLSFDENMDEALDEFDDPKSFEIQIVRDVVRSGLSDVQIESLLAKLPKPFAFNPERLAFSFRHGWVYVEPPVEIPEPSEVIEEHLDEWMAQCDEETLEDLRDKVTNVLKTCVEKGRNP
jgi:hypothetical protein